MKAMKNINGVGNISFCTLIFVLLFGVSTVAAESLSSPNYKIDSNFGGSFGGSTASTNYKMSAVGGEAIVGNGASGSYKLTSADFVDNAPSLQVSIPIEDVIFGSITSGTSQTEDFNIDIDTVAPAYSLTVQQNHNLQTGNASASIPSVSGTTATPLIWSEGSTVGLGYSIAAAPLLLSKWGSGTKFAALPNTATTFYDGTGNGQEAITMRLRLDVAGQQVADSYSSQVTISGTITP